MKKNLIFFLGLSVLYCIFGCTNSKSDWVDLLDDAHRVEWRGYNGETLPPGWFANSDSLWYQKDGLLMEKDYTGGRDVIFGGEEYEYFELAVDWKIPDGGNSGIFYHLKEGYKSPSQVSPEYQLIDDENYAKIHDLVGYNSQFGAEHPELLQDWQMTGADYAMHTANEELKILHPTGEWNSTRIVVKPGRTEHWLNGVLLLSFEPWSADWEKRKNAGKWENAPDYGKHKTGYIGFQDHGSALWFRNIRIRPIK